MTSTQPKWSAPDFYSWFRENSDSCEPGLSFQAQSLVISEELEIELCGVDALNNPFIVLWSNDCGPELEDQLHMAMSNFRHEYGKFAARFPNVKKGEANLRALVFTQALPKSSRDRLDNLCKAFPLRVFSVRIDESGTDPQLNIELPVQFGPEPWQLPGLNEIGKNMCHRLVNACASVQPPVGVLFDSWPLLLTGKRGVFASLHVRDGFVELTHLKMNQDGNRKGDKKIYGNMSQLALEDDERVDLAIDVVMRQQYSPFTKEKANQKKAKVSSLGA